VVIDFGATALASCRAVLRQAAPGDLARPTPCADYTVADLGEHLVRSMVLLAGSAGARLDPEPAASLDERITPLADATFSVWRERGVDGEVALGSRTLPAEQVHAIVLLELVVHGWDLARAISSPGYAVPAELAEYLLARAPSLITADKRGRAFADAVVVGADAGPLERLIAFTGRRP
jgi:uncharacterized protein (TIGR03086 family)